MILRSIRGFRVGKVHNVLRSGRAYAKDNPGSETLSSTVTQGVIEKNAPKDPSDPHSEVPLPTHPNRNMEVPSMVPNEHTEQRLPPQVPEMADGGKYPDPLEAPISEKMAPGPVNTKVHGTRPEADLLDVDVNRTIKGKETR